MVHVIENMPTTGWRWTFEVAVAFHSSPRRTIYFLTGTINVSVMGKTVSTEPFHLGLVLGEVPVRISRNKSYKYRVFRPMIVPSTPLI